MVKYILLKEKIKEFFKPNKRKIKITLISFLSLGILYGLLFLATWFQIWEILSIVHFYVHIILVFIPFLLLKPLFEFFLFLNIPEEWIISEAEFFYIIPAPFGIFILIIFWLLILYLISCIISYIYTKHWKIKKK